MSVEASGRAPLAYQWRLGNTNLPTGTNATLVLRPARTNDSGEYVVVVTNDLGAATSAPPALLTVMDTPPVPPPARANLLPREVQPGQEDRGPTWEMALALAFLGLLLILGVRRLVEHFNQQVQDSQDFRAALDRWSRRINGCHKTPRSAKRLVNKLRFYAMMMRALRTTGRALDVPENAIVAFGVLEGQVREGKLSPDASAVETELAPDVEALQTALQQHPVLFGYLSTTSASGAQGPPAR